jgi:hypothetical protein
MRWVQLLKTGACLLCNWRVFEQASRGVEGTFHPILNAAGTLILVCRGHFLLAAQ